MKKKSVARWIGAGIIRSVCMNSDHLWHMICRYPVARINSWLTQRLSDVFFNTQRKKKNSPSGGAACVKRHAGVCTCHGPGRPVFPVLLGKGHNHVIEENGNHTPRSFEMHTLTSSICSQCSDHNVVNCMRSWTPDKTYSAYYLQMSTWPWIWLFNESSLNSFGLKASIDNKHLAPEYLFL